MSQQDIFTSSQTRSKINLPVVVRVEARAVVVAVAVLVDKLTVVAVAAVDYFSLIVIIILRPNTYW